MGSRSVIARNNGSVLMFRPRMGEDRSPSPIHPRWFTELIRLIHKDRFFDTSASERKQIPLNPGEPTLQVKGLDSRASIPTWPCLR